MDQLAHWTQQSTADFVYNISSTFVAQIETKMEDEKISRSELAEKLNKTSGRVSQILNNPGNLSLRVMVETARPLGMKVGVIAYDDNDPSNENGPIDPDVFVKCWKRAGCPADLFEVEDAFAYRSVEGYVNTLPQVNDPTGKIGPMSGPGVMVAGYIGKLEDFYSRTKISFGPPATSGHFVIGAFQPPDSTEEILNIPARSLPSGLTCQQQNPNTLFQETAA